MIYRLLQSPVYESDFIELEPADQSRVRSFYDQLENNPLLVGKPLGGMIFFREKKFEGRRLYYLVYEEWKAVLLVGVSNKKDQSDTITKIKLALPQFKAYMANQMKQKELI